MVLLQYATFTFGKIDKKNYFCCLNFSPTISIMKYDFDKIIDRHNTNAIKVEKCNEMFGRTDIIPLWIADMDLPTPDFILDAIQKRCEHPIMGYTAPCKEYFRSITNWILERHNWDVQQEWIGFLAGIVPSISFAINTFSNPNDEVIVQPPVYPPFINVTKNNNRKVVFNPLKTINGRFEMDFDDLEQKITEKTRILVLCNPHNPGGRTWDKETLIRLAEICYKNKILVISDEIHSDLALRGEKHTPFATVSKLAEQNSITYIAPSKTFNMAGLISSSYIIPNQEIREKFQHFLESSHLGHGNIFAYIGAKSAYENGHNWLNQVIDYLQGNLEFVLDFFEKNIPQIKPMKPQASFLVWLNCKELGMNSDDLQDFMVNKVGIGMNKGTDFGTGGEHHLRLNIACPRSVLKEALNNLKKKLP